MEFIFGLFMLVVTAAGGLLTFMGIVNMHQPGWGVGGSCVCILFGLAFAIMGLFGLVKVVTDS